MGGVALLLTLSRGGWVAFAAAFCVLLTLSFAHPRLRRRFLFTRVLMIAAVVVGGMAFSGPIMKRLTQSDPGAVNFRYEWNGVAWKMIKDKPILGFGLNSFVFNMAPYTVYGTPGRLTEKFGSNWPVVHNVYLLVWAEQGTVGFAFYLGLQFYLLYVGFRNLRIFKNEILFSINLGAIAGFVAVTLDGLASFYVRNPGCDRVYWVVAGLIIAVDFWNRQHANAPSLPANLPLEQRA